ncbi:unnamed protein product [Diatraea saccharalis]|uniref:Protein takeout n=1 Tax=Diatraea saccharalis TaxID=40085 RepID=A0A9N9QPY2_9NEOP|nr:unnamed protein product [Diatraea saccharalis]
MIINIINFRVDLDTLEIRARVQFPHLHFVGKYSVDGQILVVPLKGKGTMTSDAVKANAELVLKAKTEKRGGVEYIKFTSLQTNISVKDYHIRLEGLFNGDKVLGDATNEAINQNRGDFMRAAKPYVEDTVSKLFLGMANKIVDGIPFSDVFPAP